jgi:hypothetical protein
MFDEAPLAASSSTDIPMDIGSFGNDVGSSLLSHTPPTSFIESYEKR